MNTPVPVSTASPPNIPYSACISPCPSENNQGSPHSGHKSQVVSSLDNKIMRLTSLGQCLSLSFSSCILPPHSGLGPPPPSKREGPDCSHLHWLPNKPKAPDRLIHAHRNPPKQTLPFSASQLWNLLFSPLLKKFQASQEDGEFGGVEGRGGASEVTWGFLDKA